jgi:hypothetical protein
MTTPEGPSGLVSFEDAKALYANASTALQPRTPSSKPVSMLLFTVSAELEKHRSRTSLDQPSGPSITSVDQRTLSRNASS